jgi:hypothetical protein
MYPVNSYKVNYREHNLDTDYRIKIEQNIKTIDKLQASIGGNPH